tara:strand:- start:138 stop:1232 length:1095 start_codon:yes stop_codon:yes gene_type:complete
LIKSSLKKDFDFTLDNGDFILGKKVFELEEKLANYVDVKECITCASGTDALLIPLIAQGIGPGDAVFTTNFSFFATVEVISLAGASPIFVDIDKNTFNIDPDLLEKEIELILKQGKLTPKAIIAVDLFGNLAEYNKIGKIAKKYNLFLIEDAAQSFGAIYFDRKSCSYGDIAATSFYPAKPFGCYGDGGAMFTNDSRLADKCRSIRVHGEGKDKYDNIRIGMNSRLDTLQANVLLNKLTIFDDELVKRNEIANYYSKSLSAFLQVPNIGVGNNTISSWAQYSLLAKNNKERDKLVNHLQNHGIPIAIFYKKVFSDLKLYNKYNCNTFPVSEDISKRIFSIPMHPYLKKTELDEIINIIYGFYKS